MFNLVQRLFQRQSLPHSMLNSLAVKTDSLEHNIPISVSLRDYYASFSNHNDELSAIAARLQCLRVTLESLNSALQSRHYQPSEVHLVESINRSIADCEDGFAKLQDVNRRISISLIGSNSSAYPFEPTTIESLTEDVHELRLRLSRILDIVRQKQPWQMVFHRDDGDFGRPEMLREHTSIADICSKIDVLVPDPTIHHCSVYVKRNPGTGLWLLDQPSFKNWLSRENSFLWLNGSSGCGKSVLCSTAIQATFCQNVQAPNTGIGLFYFSFNDQSRQGQETMIISLLLQLAKQQGEDGQRAIVNLYETYSAGEPPISRLLECLQKIIKKFQNVFIFLDAINENSPGDKREEVLTILGKMRDWDLPGLHVLITSRDEPDIRASLHPTQDEEAVLGRSKEIDLDIGNYISSKLITDTKLQRWKEYEDRIQQALIDSSQGVFLHVKYQLDALKRCPRTKHHLEQYLHSLPGSLDETYERILCNIDERYIDDARHILTLLTFSKRSITVSELADAYAIDPQTFQPDPNRQGLDIDSIRVLCPGLVDIVPVKDSEKEDRIQTTVRIAHSSIREYLVSSHIGQSKAAKFSLQHGTGHKLLAHIFLVYLLQPELSSGELDERKLEKFPLARFAAESWYHHYKEADRAQALDTEFHNLVSKLLTRQLGSFRTWMKLYDVDRMWGSKLHQPDSPQLPSPMYCASLLDLWSEVLKLFIHTVAEPANCAPKNPPDTLLGHGGRLGNSLQAACWNGSEMAMGILLDHGVDVNTPGGWCGNALQAACFKGHQSIVRILLDNGADINAVGGKYHTALEAASYNGHNALVRELLDRGADINAQDSKLGDALQIASSNGHQTVVRTLIERGADVNSKCGLYGNALQAASLAGNDKIVQILLDNGASINTQGGKFDNALQAAAIRRNEGVAQILLDHGADINAPCRLLGTILTAAACGGNANIIRMLLDKGADVNAQSSGTWNNALQTASVRGHEEVARLLLDRGADVHAQGGEYGTALQAAARHGYKGIVQILLAEGADVYAPGGRFGNAIEAASHAGFEDVVFILKVAGAESIAG